MKTRDRNINITNGRVTVRITRNNRTVFNRDIGAVGEPGVQLRAIQVRDKALRMLKDDRLGIEMGAGSKLFKEIVPLFVEKRPGWKYTMVNPTAYFGDYPVHTLSYVKCLAYRQERSKQTVTRKDPTTGKLFEKPVEQSTINRELAGVSACIEFTRDMVALKEIPAVKLPADNPVKILRKQKWHNEGENRRNRVLTNDDIQTFDSLATPKVRRAFWAALNTGLRKGDVFDLGKRKLVEHLNEVVGVHSKTGEVYQLPQNDTLKEILDDGMLDTTNFRGEWDAVMAEFVKLGCEYFTFRDIRRTVAWRIYKATKDIVRVQYFLGHTSHKTTEIYLGVKHKDLQEAAKLLQESLPKPVARLEVVG